MSSAPKNWTNNLPDADDISSVEGERFSVPDSSTTMPPNPPYLAATIVPVSDHFLSVSMACSLVESIYLSLYRDRGKEIADAIARRLGWNMQRLEKVLTAALTGNGEVMGEVAQYIERVKIYRAKTKKLGAKLSLITNTSQPFSGWTQTSA